MPAIANGDRRALSRLVTLFAEGLTVLATRYLGNEGDADEVVQDVFMRVWRNAGRYDPAKAKVGTWLYRITVNLCIDRQRKRSFFRFIGLEDTPTEIPDPQPSAVDRIGGAQKLAQVRAAIDALPNRQRMALLLNVVSELENRDIAEAMGISTGAVEQLLVRARRTLRQSTERMKEDRP